ncbi:MAG: SNF2-related protein [Desulfobacterales bacterium]|nr:SNF2-related protein [Desulfobacterales bacterium]
MAKPASQKNRNKKRKQKQKTYRQQSSHQAKKEKGEFYFEGALYYIDLGNYEKAESFLKKAIKRDPDNQSALVELVRLGQTLQKENLIREGFLQLYERNLLENIPAYNEGLLWLCHHLTFFEELSKAKEILEYLHARQATLKVDQRKRFMKELKDTLAFCNARLEFERKQEPSRQQSPPAPHKQQTKAAASANTFAKGKSSRPKEKTAAPDKATNPSEAAAGIPEKPNAPANTATAAKKQEPPEVPITLEIGEDGISQSFAKATPASRQHYDLVMEAIQLRFKETFDHLLCLNTIEGIDSLTYQEETARKVLKTFRGRALLADEVGMGKTIEACMVLKEYIMRKMIRNALILTPTPLVSQWQEELRSKFGLDFVSTDDPDFRSAGDAFRQQPYIVASINIAKSKKNFATVAERDWDMVIADEAHHFKNKTTLNWKLLNSLKKRFLLMLTATPVENNLMELYNLITLLKPGQLKTESEFKSEFMTKGDATDPRNRTRLKGLLDQVMIRNTRAVANIQIPPRFAETARTEPAAAETELYARITELVRDINAANGSRRRMTLQHLLAEAGSSPAAVEKTLSDLAGKKELSEWQTDEIPAIRNLTRSMGDTGKNKMVLQLIESADEKIIVFVKYRATLDHLSDVFSWHNIGHSLFHGQMPNARKDREIEKFRNENKVLLTTELGGEGRNLQFCRRMINYDLPWNPMRIEQRIGRIHRIGQTREVLIYNLCAAGTLEDYILDILDRKINMFEMVVGEIDMIMGRMRGDQDFTDMVYDIWISEASEEDRKAAFDKLGSRIKRYKTGYEKTKSLDEKLFGENYEA